MNDPRSFFANDRVAHESLRGQIGGREFTAGAARRVTSPVTDLLRAPNGKRDAQLLMGAEFDVLETRDGWCFGRSSVDGYVGYIRESALGEEEVATHRVTSRSSHIYSDGALKAPEKVALSFGCLLRVVSENDGFARLSGGGFVPTQHISELTSFAPDPALTALKLLETPYLWGGNCSFGIDCSGLVQICLHASGQSCPRDTDQQEAFFSEEVDSVSRLKRGDLVFWRGHVAMMLNEAEMIHANAHHMAVAIELLEDAKKRIGVREFGEVTSIKRPHVI